jgi:hypothetical protein
MGTLPHNPQRPAKGSFHHEHLKDFLISGWSVMVVALSVPLGRLSNVACRSFSVQNRSYLDERDYRSAFLALETTTVTLTNSNVVVSGMNMTSDEKVRSKLAL